MVRVGGEDRGRMTRLRDDQHWCDDDDDDATRTTTRRRRRRRRGDDDDAATTTTRRGRRRGDDAAGRRGDDTECCHRNVATEMMPPRRCPRCPHSRFHFTMAQMPCSPPASLQCPGRHNRCSPRPRCSYPGSGSRPPSRVSGGGAGDRGVRIAAGTDDTTTSTGGEGREVEARMAVRIAVRITDDTIARRPALLVGQR